MADGQVLEVNTKDGGIDTLLNQTDDQLSQSLGLSEVVEATSEAKKLVEVPHTPATVKPEPKAKPEAKVEEEPEEEEEVTEVPEAEEPAKKPLTQFTVMQGSEEVEVPPDLTFSFKANGKEYKDLPTDKVVLMAQMGFYNEAREEKVRASEEIVNTVGEENGTLRDLIMHLRDEFISLLGDEAYREAAIEEYTKSTSPEARARRAEDALKQEQTTKQSEHNTSLATQYVATQIYPVMKQLPEQFSHVSEDEVLGRFSRLVTPFLRNGTIPYTKLPEVKRLVENDLFMWTQALNLERDSAQKKTANVVSAEKVKTTLAKRQAARAVQPAGKAAKETRKPKTYTSAQEWAEKGLDEILGLG
jgi:hypothetical protein